MIVDDILCSAGRVVAAWLVREKSNIDIDSSMNQLFLTLVTELLAAKDKNGGPALTRDEVAARLGMKNARALKRREEQARATAEIKPTVAAEILGALSGNDAGLPSDTLCKIVSERMGFVASETEVATQIKALRRACLVSETGPEDAPIVRRDTIGATEPTPSLSSIVRHLVSVEAGLSPEGVSPTDVAQRLGLTEEAAATVLTALEEAKSIVRVEPDVERWTFPKTFILSPDEPRGLEIALVRNQALLSEMQIRAIRGNLSPADGLVTNPHLYRRRIEFAEADRESLARLIEDLDKCVNALIERAKSHEEREIEAGTKQGEIGLILGFASFQKEHHASRAGDSAGSNGGATTKNDQK